MSNSLSQQGQQRQFDTLVIGSGIAGLSYCLALLAQRPQSTIALISKQQLTDCNSYYAQGGIAAPRDDADLAQHIHDTLAAGSDLTHQQRTHTLLSGGSEMIDWLKQQGIAFQPSLGIEGGHSQRRIRYVGDYTGQAIVSALVTQVEQSQQIQCFEQHIAVNLITQQCPSKPGSPIETFGAYILNRHSGKIDTFLANNVILATGGAGKLYQYTSNPDTATGDGVAMAYRAGARVSNMEFYQFHPTLLHHGELNNFLISEALRGEGARLLRPDTLERFMVRYAPEAMEMATRDIVARAIFTEIENSQCPYVYLDIRQHSRQFLQQRFPTIYTTLKELGIDISQELIPVVPAAHYLCGGILTDECGRTDIRRLYAIGETACTGLHGANRLAGNSLLEGATMAHHAASTSLADLNQTAQPEQTIEGWDSQMAAPTQRSSQIHAHWRGLRSEMTSYAGIIRNDQGLNHMLKLIAQRSKMIENYYWQHHITADLIESRNIALVAKLIVTSALKRAESRGGHYRDDYPHSHPHATVSIERSHV
ncbi:MAG: L-aspartate oxidase [Gammaproteobacteria bacterium]|nr:L-aspartate oxidase [Gammaproteobacteria bacterium]